ncbi:helix-turn-helix transcriptional regulator [Leptospira sp. 96542]|nr:helix-turn-helix transcriptional regulator [Leptospira sp. 96542]
MALGLMVPTVIEYKPQPLLSRYVESYLHIKSGDGFSKSIIPHHSFVLTVKLKGNHKYQTNTNLDVNSLPSISLTGLRKTAKHNILSKDTEIFIIKFQPWGAFSFFKRPMHQLNEIGISAYDLWDKVSLNHLSEQLLESEDDQTKLVKLEDFLLKRIKSQTIDIRIVEAISVMAQNQGSIKIKEVASSINLSIDTFEKKFREITGGTPKQIATIIRMNSAIKNIQKYSSFTNLAHDFGYFDQSHFIREFKSFTGKTPTEFLI